MIDDWETRKELWFAVIVKNYCHLHDYLLVKYLVVIFLISASFIKEKRNG